LTEEELRACFLKTDGLPVDIEFVNVSLGENVFIAKSSLNALRREFYHKICQGRAKNEPIILREKPKDSFVFNGKNTKTAIISSQFVGVQPDVAIYKPQNYASLAEESFLKGTFEKYIYYPPFCTAEEETEIAKLLIDKTVDGVYAENYGAFTFAKKYGVKIFVGTGLNVFNSYAVDALVNDDNVSYYAISKETTTAQQLALQSDKAITIAFGD
jgi:hypothetical protein